MRKGVLIIGMTALAICFSLLFWKVKPNRTSSLQDFEAGSAKQPSLTAQQAEEPAASPSEELNHRRLSSGPTERYATNESYQQLMEAWQAPIDFYGLVIDQNSNALSGASILFSWDETPFENGEKSLVARSDAEGCFSLRNARGRVLEVQVTKEGYYNSKPGFESFKYSMTGNFSADPSNPVRFELRKKGPGVALVSSALQDRPNFPVRLARDGKPTRVNLIERKLDQNGQLELSQNKPPKNEANEWSFRVAIPEGGLVENHDTFQFEAPDTNYAPGVEYRFSKSETNWVTHLTKQFYIAFGEPRKFGWLRIESDLAQETVFLTYSINPDGSRYLEPK